jgi:uncharacterized protein with GYD domain
VAEYTVNLKLAVQGSKDLDKLNKRIQFTRKQLDKSSIGSDKFNKAIENLIKREKTYEKALTTRTKAIDNALRAQTGMQTLEQREHQLLARGNRLRDLRLRKEQALTRQRMVRRGAASAIGSGIIGGGFPLLFGQGPTAAIGGGLGGLAGGALSAIPGMGQFGFALSIAGTTIGSALDDLAKALAKPTENIEKLVTKLGLVDTPTGKLALELEKLGLTSSAATLLLSEFEEQFGISQGQIKENAEKMTKFNNEINQLGTELTLLMANSLGPFLAGIIDFARKLNQEKVIENLQIDLAEQIRATGGDKQHIDNTIKMIKESSRRIRKEQNLSFAEFQIVAANMYRTLLGYDMSPFEFKTNQNNITNNNLPNNNSPDPKLKDLEKLADDTFNLRNIVPLQQAFEIEKNRFKLTSAELNLQKEKNTLTLLNKELTLKTKENQLITTDSLKNEIAILNQKLKNQKLIVKNAEGLVNIDKLKNQASLADLDNRIKLQKESLTLLPKELNILQQKNKLSSLESALDIAKAENNQSKINNLLKQIELQNILIEQAEILANPIQAEMIMLDQQMKQLNDVGMRVVGLSQTIGSSFQESFKGIIMGTMSVADAFRNMTNRIAGYFLDMAARMIANQLQRSILGMFGGMFGGGATDVFAGFNRGPTNPNNLTMNSFANGGRPPVGRPSVVGERGPEVFVPDRKGTIIPNHALGGSTNVIVNVDASGSSVEGDEQQSRELGRLISVAVQSELVQQKRPGGLLA